MIDSARIQPAADELLAEFDAALTARRFVKLTLGKPRRGPARVEPEPTQATVRLVEIRHAPHISILLRYPTKDVTENHAITDATTVVRTLIADRFANAHLFTTQQTIELRTNNKGEARLFRGKPALSTVPPPQHDRVKRYVLDPAKAPYLHELGI